MDGKIQIAVFAASCSLSAFTPYADFAAIFYAFRDLYTYSSNPAFLLKAHFSLGTRISFSQGYVQVILIVLALLCCPGFPEILFLLLAARLILTAGSCPCICALGIVKNCGISLVRTAAEKSFKKV